MPAFNPLAFMGMANMGMGIGMGYGGGPNSDRREGDWTCPSCRANVFASKMACFKCQTPRPPSASNFGPMIDQHGHRPGDWTCPNCMSNVFSSKVECFKCRTPKPAHLGGMVAPPHSEIRPGDWTCPNCQANVFSSKPHCFKCGSAKPPEFGGVAISALAGLNNADTQLLIDSQRAGASLGMGGGGGGGGQSIEYRMVDGKFKKCVNGVPVDE